MHESVISQEIIEVVPCMNYVLDDNQLVKSIDVAPELREQSEVETLTAREHGAMCSQPNKRPLQCCWLHCAVSRRLQEFAFDGMVIESDHTSDLSKRRGFLEWHRHILAQVIWLHNYCLRPDEKRWDVKNSDLHAVESREMVQPEILDH